MDRCFGCKYWRPYCHSKHTAGRSCNTALTRPVPFRRPPPAAAGRPIPGPP
jgi:hypothetical protein